MSFSLVSQVLIRDDKLVRVVDGVALVFAEEDPLKKACDAVQSNDFLDVDLLYEPLICHPHLLVPVLPTAEALGSIEATPEADEDLWHPKEQNEGQVVSFKALPVLYLRCKGFLRRMQMVSLVLSGLVSRNF